MPETPADMRAGNPAAQEENAESDENCSNDLQASCILGAQPKGKTNDCEEPHCEAAEQISCVGGGGR